MEYLYFIFLVYHSVKYILRTYYVLSSFFDAVWYKSRPLPPSPFPSPGCLELGWGEKMYVCGEMNDYNCDRKQHCIHCTFKLFNTDI